MEEPKMEKKIVITDRGDADNLKVTTSDPEALKLCKKYGDVFPDALKDQYVFYVDPRYDARAVKDYILWRVQEPPKGLKPAFFSEIQKLRSGSCYYDDGYGNRVEVSAVFDTEAERDRYAENFPDAVKKTVGRFVCLAYRPNRHDICVCADHYKKV